MEPHGLSSWQPRSLGQWAGGCKIETPVWALNGWASIVLVRDLDFNDIGLAQEWHFMSCEAARFLRSHALLAMVVQMWAPLPLANAGTSVECHACTAKSSRICLNCLPLESCFLKVVSNFSVHPPLLQCPCGSGDGCTAGRVQTLGCQIVLGANASVMYDSKANG